MIWLDYLSYYSCFLPPFICGFAIYGFRLIVSYGPKILDGKSQKEIIQEEMLITRSRKIEEQGLF